MTKECNISVGGIQPLTMIDFPGRLASVIFVNGCNLRCKYCYNHELLASGESDTTSWDEVVEFLKDRQGFLEGVVFSGGEPCLQHDIIEAMTQVRDMGFELSLHTNGFYPKVVKEILEKRLVNYIAIDFKASLANYEKTAGASCNIADYEETVKLVVNSNVENEFRTTVHPSMISEVEIREIANYLSDVGAKKYALQKFQHGRALDKKLPPVTNYWLSKSLVRQLKAKFQDFEIRGDISYTDIVMPIPEILAA